MVLQSHRLRMVVAAKRFTQNLTDIAGSLQHKETMSSLRLYSAIRRILLEEVFKLLGMSISNVRTQNAMHGFASLSPVKKIIWQ